MKIIRFAALAVLFVAVQGAATAAAAVLHFEAFLSGPNESPVNASPGTGTALVDLDTTANTMHVHVDFTDLIGTATASNIHSATMTAGAGTVGVATTSPTFSGFPFGVTSGTYDNTLDMTLATSYNPAFVTANGGTTAGAQAALFAGIIAGKAYLNIHSTVFPGGEIRGFLTPVPEPATSVLAAFGGLALLAARRRRRFSG